MINYDREIGITEVVLCIEYITVFSPWEDRCAIIWVRNCRWDEWYLHSWCYTDCIQVNGYVYLY